MEKPIKPYQHFTFSSHSINANNIMFEICGGEDSYSPNMIKFSYSFEIANSLYENQYVEYFIYNNKL